MTTFDTTEPLSVVLEFDVGTARISAGKRDTTVVEVLPRDGAQDSDVRVARDTRVSCSGGTLVVKAPKQRSVFGRAGSIDVSIELPAGSRLRAVSPMAHFTCEGPLGDCDLKTSLGDITLTEATAVTLKTGHGDIRVGHVTGDAEILGAGRVDVGTVTGTATVKNGNGPTSIDDITGDLRATCANGSISVGVARAGVEARTASGGIRIGQVVRGRVDLQAAVGDIEVGIGATTAARLDVSTRFGTVRNSLGASDGPADGDETAQVRAGTQVGDIVIHRS